jgi:hypothetical protein
MGGSTPRPSVTLASPARPPRAPHCAPPTPYVLRLQYEYMSEL